jgi:hypothetical protein
VPMMFTRRIDVSGQSLQGIHSILFNHTDWKVRQQSALSNKALTLRKQFPRCRHISGSWLLMDDGQRMSNRTFYTTVMRREVHIATETARVNGLPRQPVVRLECAAQLSVGWKLIQALFINSRGEMSGLGVPEREDRVVLLRPKQQLRRTTAAGWPGGFLPS